MGESVIKHIRGALEILYGRTEACDRIFPENLIMRGDVLLLGWPRSLDNIVREVGAVFKFCLICIPLFFFKEKIIATANAILRHNLHFVRDLGQASPCFVVELIFVWSQYMILYNLCGHSNVPAGSHDNTKDNWVKSASKRRCKIISRKGNENMLFASDEVAYLWVLQVYNGIVVEQKIRVADNKCSRYCEVVKS